MPHNVDNAVQKLIVRWNGKLQKALRERAQNPCDQTRDQVEWCKKHLEQYGSMIKLSPKRQARAQSAN